MQTHDDENALLQSKAWPEKPKVEQNGKAPEDHSAEEARNTTFEGEPEVEKDQEAVYQYGLEVLNAAAVPYLVGAAFARQVYTDIWRGTKDLDLFVAAEDLKHALDVLREAGFKTSVESQRWLAKAVWGEHFIDLVFAANHGQVTVDRSWYQLGRQAQVLGVPVQLVPVEEMIAMAAFVAGRNRFDGAEVAHLIHSQKGKLDWQRLLHLMGGNRQVLLWHLIFFNIVYPGHADYLPRELMSELFGEIQTQWSQPMDEKAFRGIIFDPFSFRVDVDDWGYEDRRETKPIVDERGALL